MAGFEIFGWPLVARRVAVSALTAACVRAGPHGLAGEIGRRMRTRLAHPPLTDRWAGGAAGPARQIRWLGSGPHGMVCARAIACRCAGPHGMDCAQEVVRRCAWTAAHGVEGPRRGEADLLVGIYPLVLRLG